MPGIRISGTIVTTSPLDTYGVFDQYLLIGSWASVADVAERDAIDTTKRKEGMKRRTNSTGEEWVLQADLTTWVLDSPGGGGATSLSGDVSGTAVSGNIATTLATIVTATSKGTAARSPVITIDQKGRTTVLTDVLIAIAESQVTNLVADLASKINTTAIGVTVCPLVAGLVPLANLPFGVIAYKGLYNATTNTPAILNGVGTAGDFYIANVIGNAYAPVNVTIINQIVAYNGATWQVGAVFGGGIQNIVTASGTLSGGTVTLNSTAQVNDSAGRRYVTDAIQTGLINAPTTPSAINPFLTRTDVLALVTVSGGGYITPEQFNGGHAISDNLSTAISVYYTLPQANVQFPLTAANYPGGIVISRTLAWACFQEAFYTQQVYLGASSFLATGQRYCFNAPMFLPFLQATVADYNRANKYGIDFNYALLTNTKGSAMTHPVSGNPMAMFDRMPATQAAAITDPNNMIAYNIVMKNAAIRGANLTRGSHDFGVRIGATYNSSLENISFYNFDIPLLGYFCLSMKVKNVSFGFSTYMGIYLASGAGTGLYTGDSWSGASTTNSCSNNVELSEQCQFATANGSYSSIGCYASDGFSLLSSVIEQGSSEYLAVVDAQDTTLVQKSFFDRVHIECTASKSMFKAVNHVQIHEMNMRDCDFFIPDSSVIPILEAETGSSGTIKLVATNMPSSNQTYKFRKTGTGTCRLYVDMVQMPDQNNMLNAANWDTRSINGLSGLVPSDGNLMSMLRKVF